VRELLQSIMGRRPDGRPDATAVPLIPLLDTTLLTNALGAGNYVHILSEHH